MRSFDLVVVEGDLEIAIATRILSERGHPTSPELYVNKRGQAAFWRDAPRLNEAARNLAILGLVDLEQEHCVSGLLSRKLPRGKAAQFVLRVAVRMSESWLLADTANVASYFKIPEAKLPRQPDIEPHPKRELVRLVQLYSTASLRRDMVPQAGRAVLTGPFYEEHLADFARKYWNTEAAARRSPSLKRSLQAIDKFLGT